MQVLCTASHWDWTELEEQWMTDGMWTSTKSPQKKDSWMPSKDSTNRRSWWLVQLDMFDGWFCCGIVSLLGSLSGWHSSGICIVMFFFDGWMVFAHCAHATNNNPFSLFCPYLYRFYIQLPIGIRRNWRSSGRPMECERPPKYSIGRLLNAWRRFHK